MRPGKKKTVRVDFDTANPEGWREVGKPFAICAQLLRNGDSVTVGISRSDAEITCDMWELGALFASFIGGVVGWCEEYKNQLSKESLRQFSIGFIEFAAKYGQGEEMLDRSAFFRERRADGSQ